MDRQTPETPSPRDAETIAKELRALHTEAARSFVPANVKRAAELMADFADAAVAELRDVREKLDAAELEIASLHAAE